MSEAKLGGYLSSTIINGDLGKVESKRHGVQPSVQFHFTPMHNNHDARVSIFGVPALMNLIEGLSLDEGKTLKVQGDVPHTSVEFGCYGGLLWITAYTVHDPINAASDSTIYGHSLVISSERAAQIRAHIRAELEDVLLIAQKSEKKYETA